MINQLKEYGNPCQLVRSAVENNSTGTLRTITADLEQQTLEYWKDLSV